MQTCLSCYILLPKYEFMRLEVRDLKMLPLFTYMLQSLAKVAVVVIASVAATVTALAVVVSIVVVLAVVSCHIQFCCPCRCKQVLLAVDVAMTKGCVGNQAMNSVLGNLVVDSGVVVAAIACCCCCCCCSCCCCCCGLFVGLG